MDADDAKTIPIGRSKINDSQWLGNNKCICLADNTSITEYDRLTHTLTPNTNLPFSCFKIGEPSPNGRFIFAAGGLGGRNGALVDLEEKMTAQVDGGTGITWITDNTFAYSRDVPSSDLRGVWARNIREHEKRVLLDPYLISNEGPLLKVLRAVGLIVVATHKEIETISPVNTSIVRSAKYSDGVVKRIAEIQTWAY